MKQEVLMLLTKVYYAAGDHQVALDHLEEATLDCISFTNLSSRKMKLVGECYAIKGFGVAQYNCFELISKCASFPSYIGHLWLQNRRTHYVAQWIFAYLIGHQGSRGHVLVFRHSDPVAFWVIVLHFVKWKIKGNFKLDLLHWNMKC